VCRMLSCRGGAHEERRKKPTVQGGGIVNPSGILPKEIPVGFLSGKDTCVKATRRQHNHKAPVEAL